MSQQRNRGRPPDGGPPDAGSPDAGSPEGGPPAGDPSADALDALGLRPLSARSVVASVLLGTHPPELAAGVLVRLCERFGIAPGTTRVALSRMVGSGELAPTGSGYRLVGDALLSRQRAQDEALEPPAGPWDGLWRMAVVVRAGRRPDERAELRRALLADRFGEWREGVWLRPANLSPRRAATGRDGSCRWLAVRPEGDPGTLARELWDLAGWAATGRRLLSVTEAAPLGLPGAPAPRATATFAAAAALLRHLRTDPLLPTELLPGDWPADELRRRYGAHLRAIGELVEALAVAG